MDINSKDLFKIKDKINYKNLVKEKGLVIANEILYYCTITYKYGITNGYLEEYKEFADNTK